MKPTPLFLLSLATVFASPTLAQNPSRMQFPGAAVYCDLDRYVRRWGLPRGLDTLVLADSLNPPLKQTTSPAYAYPVAQRTAGVEGWVVIGVLVTHEGRVAVANVMASSDTSFEQSTLGFFRGSQFEPPRAAGRPVWTFWCQCMTFRIAGSR